MTRSGTLVYRAAPLATLVPNERYTKPTDIRRGFSGYDRI
jgi:hypothetical protein